MSAEKWLYPITMRAISHEHALNLTLLLDHTKHIILPACAPSGTGRIQVDLIAVDYAQRTIVLAECKNYITFQGVSECAEQLVLKTYLLKMYLSDNLGKGEHQAIAVEAIANYRLIRYVSLGHQGKEYANANSLSDDETRQRLDMYQRYMNSIGRCGIGVLIFKDIVSAPIVKLATPSKWNEVT